MLRKIWSRRYNGSMVARRNDRHGLPTAHRRSDQQRSIAACSRCHRPTSNGSGGGVLLLPVLDFAGPTGGVGPAGGWVLMILVGTLILTGYFTVLNSYALRLVPAWVWQYL